MVSVEILMLDRVVDQIGIQNGGEDNIDGGSFEISFWVDLEYNLSRSRKKYNGGVSHDDMVKIWLWTYDKKYRKL